MTHEPNMGILRNLYQFGGLTVYQVLRFDGVMFRVEVAMRTFNERAAKDEAERLRSIGFPVTIESFIVNFDGAFSKEADK